MKTFKEWWNSPLSQYYGDNLLISHRGCAENAWNFAYEMQEHRIRKMDAEIKDIQEKHLDSIRALRTANEQIINIAKDNGQLRTEIESYQEPVPVECEQVVYVATHTVEEDTFYVGSLREIMEWCEDQFLTVNSLKFYRLGDEIRVGFCDLGKETRFKNV